MTTTPMGSENRCWHRRLIIAAAFVATGALVLLPFDLPVAIWLNTLRQDGTFLITNQDLWRIVSAFGDSEKLLTFCLLLTVIGGWLHYLSSKTIKSSKTNQPQTNKTNTGNNSEQPRQHSLIRQSRSVLWLLDNQLSRVAVKGMLHYALSGVLIILLKIIFGRARPWQWFSHNIHDWLPLALAEGHSSFPSGHANSSMSVALVFYVFYRNPALRLLLLLLVLLVGSARVMLFKHFPSDILAGWAVAFLTMIIMLDTRPYCKVS